MLKVGTTCFEAVLTWELEVLAILKGAQKVFTLYLRGGAKRSTLSWGGGAKVLDLQFFHFVAPLPVINDRSLSKSSGYCASLIYSCCRRNLLFPFYDACSMAICDERTKCLFLKT